MNNFFFKNRYEFFSFHHFLHRYHVCVSFLLNHMMTMTAAVTLVVARVSSVALSSFAYTTFCSIPSMRIRPSSWIEEYLIKDSRI